MIRQACGPRVIRLLSLNLSDYRALAWLCRMAAIGCLHENRSLWAMHLREQAKQLEFQADFMGPPE